MKLNKNNWFGRYYNFIYGYYPDDVCSFFWGSVTAIILAPLILTGRLIPGSSKYVVPIQAAKGLITLVTVSFFSLLTISLGNSILGIFGYEFLYTWSIILGGFALGIISLAIITGIVVGVYWLNVGVNRTIGYIAPETHIIDNTVSFIGAIRGKYCTRITWKN